MSEDLKSLLSRYFSILEDFDFMVLGLPETVLPSSRKQIKEFLSFYGISAANSNDRDLWKSCFVGYVHSAFFIPDEKYNKVKKGYSFNGINFVLKENANFKCDLLHVQNEIMAEEERLAKEYFELTTAHLSIQQVGALTHIMDQEMAEIREKIKKLNTLWFLS